MQEKLMQNLDNLHISLEKILKQLGLGFYSYHIDYYILDKTKMKANGQSHTYKGKKFVECDHFFKQLSYHDYPMIRIEKEASNIFKQLYTSATDTEKNFLLNHYNYFITFDQALNFLEKYEKDTNKHLYFVTHNKLKGKLREVSKEEKLLMKIYHLEPANFYENLLAYLSNHAEIYRASIYAQLYQGMLKNVINEYLPEKRKSFAIFTGDNQKKYLHNDSILYENTKIECEIVLHLNKTVLEETYTLDNFKEKHEVTNEQNKLINNIDSLLEESRSLNIKEVYKIPTRDKEILIFYITKESNDITKEDIVRFIESSFFYWKNNINDLKHLELGQMIKKIAHNGEIVNLHNKLDNKLNKKGNIQKKVKI